MNRYEAQTQLQQNVHALEDFYRSALEGTKWHVDLGCYFFNTTTNEETYHVSLERDPRERNTPFPQAQEAPLMEVAIIKELVHELGARVTSITEDLAYNRKNKIILAISS